MVAGRVVSVGAVQRVVMASPTAAAAPAAVPAAAPADIADVHADVLRSSEGLKVQRSALNGQVSVHTMKKTTTFSTLFQFQRIATNQHHGGRSFVGSIAGSLVLSINSGYGFSAASSSGGVEGKRSKKRGRDTSEEDAERAVWKVRSSNAAASVTKASYAAAKQCVADMLKLRGAGGEVVVESWAVSVRTKGEWGATAERETLVLGARLVAGVALPLGALCAAVATCRDGLLTVDTEKVDAAFDLPLSDQGKAAQGSGQRSILLMAAVPHVPDPARA